MINMFTQMLHRIPVFFSAASLDCDADRKAKLLGIFPKWYAYIKDYQPIDASGPLSSPSCGILGGKVADHLIAIGLSIIDILLRAGGLIAVIFVMYGGVRYILSQGEPENTRSALQTIINAFIGLAIVIVAAAIVAFIGNSLGGA